MRISHNLAHWLCLFGGIALIVTGFTARMMLGGASGMATNRPGASGQTQARPNAEILSQRALLIVLGIAVVIYSLTRLVY